MKLKNKVAVITGASSGIGKGITERFLKEGAKVVGCGIEDTMEKLSDELIYFKADISIFEDAKKVIEEGIKKFEKIDILVNCAGITGVGNIETTSPKEFEKQFSINVFGSFNVTKAATPELKKSKGASIINIASDLGIKPIPDRIAYCPAKAAIIMFTKCMAIDMGPYIRVNAIMPGLTETPMIKDRIEKSENPDEFRKQMADMYLLKRMCKIEDLANAAVFLASEESTFITGDYMAVCGGGHL